MITEVNSWEYIRGEELIQLNDWLHSLFSDEELQNISGYIEMLGDKISFSDVEKEKSYPRHEWNNLLAGCGILSWMISHGHYHSLSFSEYCADKKEDIAC